MSFRDHFSRQAAHYSRYRPSYPSALFDYLASLLSSHERAWDCGTGNGQAALQLARHFQEVIATDASAEQIEKAVAHEKVTYRVEKAESTSLHSASVDLITVSTAVHWFDFDSFYREVRRAAKPEGILAVWTYHLPLIAPGVDAVLKRIVYDILGDYWPERLHYLEDHYRTLPFPFQEIEPPQFHIEREWDLEDLAGFIASWSATRNYIEAEERHPLDAAMPALLEKWGEPHRKRKITWPIYLRIGRVHA